MATLNSRWELRTPSGRKLLDDTEEFCRQIVRSTRLNLTEHQRDALLQQLLIDSWKLAQQWDRLNDGRAFKPYARGALRRRAYGWATSKDAQAEGLEGRTRWKFSKTANINPGYRGKTIERKRVRRVPIDDPGLADHPALGRHEEDRPSDLIRALTPRDRDPDRPTANDDPGAPPTDA